MDSEQCCPVTQDASNIYVQDSVVLEKKSVQTGNSNCTHIHMHFGSVRGYSIVNRLHWCLVHNRAHTVRSVEL